MTRLFPLAALLPALSVPLFCTPGHAAGFSPEQRQEIVAIVRDALKTDPTILRDAIAALQESLIAQREAASHAALAAHLGELVSPADPFAGNPHGDVTIVEFFDTRCPYCRTLNPVTDQLLSQDRGVKLVYKDLPVLGPASVIGAKALLAAQNQGGYAKLRAALMRMPPDLTPDGVRQAAQGLGLDTERLMRDMDDPAVQQRIDANLRLAQELEIRGTPALVIGDAMVPGAVGLERLQALVTAARARSKQE